jgi:WD40 repeat protein
VKVWEVTTGKEVFTLRGHSMMVFSVAFSPDGRRIVSGSFDGTVKLWDAATGEEVLTLRGHQSGVLAVAFSPDGHRIAAGSWTIKVWDATPLEEKSAAPAEAGVR